MRLPNWAKLDRQGQEACLEWWAAIWPRTHFFRYHLKHIGIFLGGLVGGLALLTLIAVMAVLEFGFVVVAPFAGLAWIIGAVVKFLAP